MRKLSQIKELYQQRLHDPNKKAAVAVVISDDKILGVSRKENPHEMGLPGGKAEPGETPEETCLRELEEETGLQGKIVRHLLTDYEIDYLVSCFLVEVTGGSLGSSEEGVVRYCEPKELLRGPFGEYNQKAFQVLSNEGL